MRWEKVQLHTRQLGFGDISSGPDKRWGHTCNAIKGGRFLYVFGGYGKDNCQTNQVDVYNTVEQTWSQPEVKGVPPTPRDSHTCTTVGDNLFVFGGTDGMNPLKDLHILDTSSHTWISPSLRGEEPEAREGHSAALVDKRIYIFGGCGKSSDTNQEVYFNDLYILNTETFVWKRAITTGTIPSARDGHTCSSWRNKIIVVGGEDGHDYYLSDVHILDADTLIWKKLITPGLKLPPRAGHSTIAYGRNLFVFGGFTDCQNLYDDIYMLDIDTGLWTKVITTGDGPSARFSMAGDCLDPIRGGVLVFIGGCNKSLEALDDMYYLYTGVERRLEKLSLRKQLKLRCQEQNLTNSMHDNSLVGVEISDEYQQSTPVSSYVPPIGREIIPISQAAQFSQPKKTFRAKVTDSFPYGHIIETIIDGKLLRGILFAKKPNPFPTIDHNSTRKRASEESGVMLNGDCNSSSKLSKLSKQGSVDHHQQADAVQAKDSTTSHGREAVATPEMKSQISLNFFQPDKETSNQKPSSGPLNLNEEWTNEAPVSGMEATNDVMCTTMKGILTTSPNQDASIPATGHPSVTANMMDER